MRKVTIAILGLIFAFWGQRQFSANGYISDALILYAIGAFFFIYASAGVVSPNLPRAEQIRRKINYPAMAIALLLVIAASSLFARYLTTNLGLILWLFGIILFIIGFQLPFSSFRLSAPSFREAIILVLILFIALFMRMYRLSEMPPSFYLDEGDNCIWALQFMEEPYSPFTEHRDSNATFPFYLLGIAFKFSSGHILTIRWLEVAVGMVTVFIFYILARSMFSLPAAQFATFLLAVSRWHINFSRIGFQEALLVPLFEALVILFLWRGDFAWAGLAFGLGFHTYIGYRVFPLVVLATVLHRAILVRRWLRRNFLHLFIFALATFVTLAPLGVYVAKFPEIFLRRIKAASVMNDIKREGSLAPFWANVKKTLLMFNYKGDPRPRHNLPHTPMLDFLTAIAFALGMGYSLFHWREWRHFIPIIWLLIGFLPGVLSLADSNPHSLRTLGNVPPVFLLVAAFWERLWAVIRRGWRECIPRPFIFAALALLLASNYLNFYTYFHKQARDRSVYYDFNPHHNIAALYIREVAPLRRAIVSRAFTNHSAVKFIDRDVPYESLDLNLHIPLREELEQGVVYILETAHSSVLKQLRSIYPGGVLEEHYDRYGQLAFYSYEVSDSELVAIQGLVGRFWRGIEMRDEPEIERKEASLDFSWPPMPLPPPFTAVWEGSIYLPRYGPYTFILDSSGYASLSIGGRTPLEVEGGRAEAALTLPAGFHPISIRCTQEGEEGHLRLSWIIPGGTEEVVPRSAFYPTKLSGFGLMGKYYHGAENWTGQPAVIQIDPFIAPNDVLHAPFSIQWEGKLYVPASGLYTFGTKSDDGSFLYIDGKLVVDNGGQHGDRYVEGRIELEKGFHDIVILYFQAGGGRKMEFWWTPPGGAKEIVPVDYLIPPGVPAKEPVKMVTPPPAPTALGEVRYLTGWGGQGEEEGLFQGPRGVAAAKGKVYVADTRNRRIQVFDAKGRFIASFGREAGLEEPFDLVVDEQGNIYVLDPLKDCVVKLSPEGRLLGKLGTKFGLYRPRGIDIHNGSLYIADTGGNRVMVISTDGELRAIIGEAGSGPGQFNQPTDVAVDDAGNIYVADTYNLRLQKLDSLGRYILEWPIPRANTFDGPHIAIWKGIIYMTDPEGHRVAAYNVEGELIGEWGGAGEGPGQFNKPVGLAVDAEGRVYIADAYNHRVQKFEVVK